MTKEQAIEGLRREQSRREQSRRDIEASHVEADLILCELLDDLGCTEVVAEYKKVAKWHA